MSLHYLVKYECQKVAQSEICIVINGKSQGTVAKHLSWDGLLHYKFIIQFAGEIIFEIGEHLAKFQAKWLIESCAHGTAVHFCPKRCRTRQISKITSILRTKTVTNCCYVNRQINRSLFYQQISNFCRPASIY